LEAPPHSTSIPADVIRRRISLPDRHIEIAVQDWGGDGPLALLHHANGFCAALWAPVAERLRERFHVVAMDARGQGDSGLPPEGAGAEAFAWPTLRDDLLGVARTVLDETGHAQIALGLGHSFGGTLTLAAAAEVPSLFGRLLLVDPVIFPLLTPDEARQRSDDKGLVARSRKRRHVWPDRPSARAFFAERELFADWTPRALDLYVEEGLRDRANGEVELKCSGEVEAHIFGSGHTLDIFDAAPRVEAPVRILWAQRGSFPLEIYHGLVSTMRAASIETVDAGHLVPMEQPDIVVDAIEADFPVEGG
jgi:pimeloyl-ACP methyl ester carboxylesterase